MTDAKEEKNLDDEINLLDYLIIPLKHIKKIIIATLLVTIIIGIISSSLSKLYYAQTKILLPERGTNLSNQLLSQFGGLANIVLGGGIGQLGPYMYIELLKSQRVYDAIIDRFNLMETYGEVYEIEKRQDAWAILAGKVSTNFVIPEGLSIQQSRILMISFMDEDPKTAADMANAFAEELGNIVQTFALTDASQKRIFFEKQMSLVKENLIKSEETLKDFQEKTGLLKVESQAGAVLEGMANLKAQIAAKEVELKVMKTYSTSQNPDLDKLNETLKALKVELKKLEEKVGDDPDPLMPTGRIPAAGLEYKRKYREVQYNEKLFQLMAQQYEMAKVEEASNPEIIQVIDKAIPPTEPFEETVTRKAMIAASMTFFLSVFMAYFIEYFDVFLSNKENKEKFLTLKNSLSIKRKK
jgi:uncharacterized protein involved in exopolysaccharide biosynthesis